MKTSFTLVERTGKSIESLIMMFSGEYGQISIEDFNDEFRNIGSFSFFLFWSFDQDRKDPIEGSEKSSRIQDDFFGFWFIGLMLDLPFGRLGCL